MLEMNRTILIFAAALILISGCSERGDLDGRTDFAGRWEGTAQKTGSPNPSIILEIKQEDGAITGILNTLDGSFVDVSISDTKLEQGLLSFHAAANGGDQFRDHLFLFTVRRVGDELHGTWTDILEGAEGPLVLEAAEGKEL